MSEVKPGKKRLPLRSAGYRVPEDPKVEPYLIASRCRNCGQHFSEKRIICLRCGKQEIEEVALSGKGKIYSYSVIHQQLPGALVKVPYAVVQVTMEEGCLVHGVVTEGYDSLKIGMPMEVYFEKMLEDEEGNDLLAYKFRAVKG